MDRNFHTSPEKSHWIPELTGTTKGGSVAASCPFFELRPQAAVRRRQSGGGRQELGDQRLSDPLTFDL